LAIEERRSKRGMLYGQAETCLGTGRRERGKEKGRSRNESGSFPTGEKRASLRVKLEGSKGLKIEHYN